MTVREDTRLVEAAEPELLEEPYRGRAYRRRFAHGLLALLLTVAGGTWGVVGSLLIFPLLSDNNDEAVTLHQAESLANGMLFPRAPRAWESFLPWLNVHSDGRFVSKFNPVWPGFIAAAKLALGTERAALAASGAAAVLTAYLLALQILRSRRHALLAATFFALSPIFVVQSTMFLSYLPTLALLQGFAAALLAGTRRQSRHLLLLSGVLGGLAGFSRPFDLVLFGVPFGLWFVVSRGRDLRLLVSQSGWVALGASGPAAAMFAYFYAATGSPFRLPFNLLDPADRFGFGLRRMVREWGYTSYSPAEAWEGMIGLLTLSSFWFFGALPLLVMGLLALRQSRLSDPGVWLGFILLTVPIGYFFFWGSYGSYEWGGPERMGPFYYLLLVAPITVLGARGLARLWHWDRRLTVVALVGMVGLSGWVVGEAVLENRRFTAERRQLYGPLLDQELDNALVFLPGLQGPWLMQPFALARNGPTLEGPVLWALDRGHERNLEVAAEFPDRTPYLLGAEGEHRAVRPTLDFETHLEEQRVVRGPRATIDVVLVGMPSGPVRLDVTSGLRVDSFDYLVPPHGDRVRLTLEVGAGSTRFVEPSLPRTTTIATEHERELEVSAWTTDESGDERLAGRDHIGISYRRADVQILMPAGGPPAGDRMDLYLVPPAT